MAFLSGNPFPNNIAYGAVGGPGYSTDLVTLFSGHENRNQNWPDARCTWDVAKGCKTAADVMQLLSHFRVAKGRMNSFPFLDFTDYHVLTGEGVMVALGGGTFQLTKQYVTASGTELRAISLPGSAVIKQGATTLTLSTHYTINATTGIITVLGSPTPAPDSWTTDAFYVPARYDIDQLRIAIEDLDYFKSQTISIVEVRI